MRRRDTVRAALFAAFAAIAAYLLLTRDGGLAGGGDASPADERSDVGPIGDAAPTPIDAAPAARLDVHGTTRSASGSIRLRVVDGDTRLPVAAAAIIVAGVAANGKRLEVSAETGEDGNAVVAKVAVGEGYVVRVAPPAVRPIERRDVAVREDDVTDLGTIYTAAHGVVEGVVVDDNGKPLASVAVGATMDPATLGAFDADPFPQPIGFATPIESVTTDAAGAFRFASLPLGLVALRADLEGYRTAIDRALVEKKAAAARVRIVLTRGVTFRGRVEGGEGKGIAHALVEIGTSERGAFGVRVAVETDADGNFEAQGFAAVRNLSPAVRVTAPDRTPVLFERVRPVEEFMRLVLRGGAHLEITVLDAWRESPVADALVTQVRAPDRDDTVGMGRYEATTDGRGRAVLHLPAGTAARPTLLARGYLTGAIVEEHGSLTGKNLRYRGDVVLPLGDGETRSLVVWMRHGPLVMGSVRDATGVLLARARVRAEYPDGKRGATVETDGAGEYRLSDVAVPSRPEIVARSWDGLSDAREKIPPVWRDEEQAIRIDLRLAPVLDPSALSGAAAPLAGASKALARATVRGRVLDPSHAAIPGALIAGGRQRVRSDDRGEFTIADVPVVEEKPAGGFFVHLSVSADGYFTGGVRLAAEDGDVLDARDVILGIGFTIRGTVRWENGNVLPFPTLLVLEREGLPLRTTAGREDGTFEIRGLPAAHSYAVEARGLGYVSRTPVWADLSRPGAVPSVDVVVVPHVVVEGRVEDEAGRPVANASVAFHWRGSRPDTGRDERTTATSDAGGRFRLFTMATNVAGIVATTREAGSDVVPFPAPGVEVKLVVKRGGGVRPPR